MARARGVRPSRAVIEGGASASNPSGTAPVVIVLGIAFEVALLLGVWLRFCRGDDWILRQVWDPDSGLAHAGRFALLLSGLLLAWTALSLFAAIRVAPRPRAVPVLVGVAGLGLAGTLAVLAGWFVVTVETTRGDPAGAAEHVARADEALAAGDDRGALEHSEAAIAAYGPSARAWRLRAWIWATTAQEELRRGRDPYRHRGMVAPRATIRGDSRPGSWVRSMEVQAAVWARYGRYDVAASWQESLLSALEWDGDAMAEIESLRERLELYRSGRPYTRP